MMVFFPSDRFAKLPEGISKEHTLVLLSFVIDELMAVWALRAKSIMRAASGHQG